MMEVGHGEERSEDESEGFAFEIVVMKDVHGVFGLPNWVIVENLSSFFPNARKFKNVLLQQEQA